MLRTSPSSRIHVRNVVGNAVISQSLYLLVQGLAAIQDAKKAGASRIIAVDVNPAKFHMAIKLGATDTVDSSKLDKPVQNYIAGDLTPWGVDYSFDCTGNVNVMRAALECSHRGWGHVVCDWSGRFGSRDFNASIPAGDGTRVE